MPISSLLVILVNNLPSDKVGFVSVLSKSFFENKQMKDLIDEGDKLSKMNLKKLLVFDSCFCQHAITYIKVKNSFDYFIYMFSLPLRIRE